MDIIQGYKADFNCTSLSSILIIRGDGYKLTSDNVIGLSGGYKIQLEGSITSGISAGDYKYQVLNPEGIQDQGDLTVKINFLIAGGNAEYKSKYQVLLEAVQAQLANTATSAQKSISIGDKRIDNFSLSELLRLREYYKNMLLQANGKRKKGDEAKIRYIWGVR